MPAKPLRIRVEQLEHEVSELKEIPARVAGVESQILQLRRETQMEFSAVHGKFDGLRGEVDELRTEMRAEFADVRAEMRGGFAAIRAEMHAEFTVVRGEMQEQISGLRGEMHEIAGALHVEIREVATHMRVLHEDVISRLELIGEAIPPKKGAKRPGPKKRR